jgi:hypothetical protein
MNHAARFARGGIVILAQLDCGLIAAYCGFVCAVSACTSLN